MKPPGIPTKHVEITVNLDGSTDIAPHGYLGTTCKEATAELERSLGRVTKRENKEAEKQKERA